MLRRLSTSMIGVVIIIILSMISCDDKSSERGDCNSGRYGVRFFNPASAWVVSSLYERREGIFTPEPLPAYADDLNYENDDYCTFTRMIMMGDAVIRVEYFCELSSVMTESIVSSNVSVDDGNIIYGLDLFPNIDGETFYIRKLCGHGGTGYGAILETDSLPGLEIDLSVLQGQKQ